ncbi:MAG: YhcH/YjgK/YiaL family protein [Treponema sp.]|nr:YhcH/YjgK/YiaL family protein [Treponema sp.]
MICASYKELAIPAELKSANWEKALAWLKGESWKKLPPGKTEIDGAKVFVLHTSAMNKPLAECRWESHRLYADIQVAIKGSELIQVCQRKGLKVTEPYSAEKDVDFLEGKPEVIHSIVLAFPQAVVLFPWDVHMPSIAPDNKPGQVEKIVIKVAL